MTAGQPPTATDALLDLCVAAGDAICTEYGSSRADEFRAKADDSPLTRADIASHRILVEGLRRLAPEVPILSEESKPEAIADRRSWERLWIVDPLDGTKEFLGRTGEFTINIALVDGQRPVLGILYLPLERAAWVGVPGEGAWRCVPDGDGWARYPVSNRDRARERDRDQGRERGREQELGPGSGRSRMSDSLPAAAPAGGRGGEGIVVLASRRHRNQRLERAIAFLEAEAGPVQRLNSGSALKFVQLAAGQGDVYPRFSPCSEWDVAAGQALLEGAGGAVLGLDGQPLRYNARESLLSPHFLAVADPSLPLWGRLLAAL